MDESKEVYDTLVSLEGREGIPEATTPEGEAVKKPSIPLKDIVTQKYVTCFECGQKMRTLRNNIKKAHGLSGYRSRW